MYSHRRLLENSMLSQDELMQDEEPGIEFTTMNKVAARLAQQHEDAMAAEAKFLEMLSFMVLSDHISESKARQIR
jgi:hypothetical protein